MAIAPSAPTHTQPSETEIAEAILSALAEVRAQPVSELREELGTAGGDLEIDSREVEAVIAILETRYGRSLAKVEDLEPECLPTMGSLGDLIRRRWADGPEAEAAASNGLSG